MLLTAEMQCFPLTHRPLGDLKAVLFSKLKLIFMIDGWGISCEVALR